MMEELKVNKNFILQNQDRKYITEALKKNEMEKTCIRILQ